jgi:hypothetical protein
MDSDLERFWGGLRDVCSGSSSATVRDATRDVGDRHIRELQAAREELRRLRDRPLLMFGIWAEGDNGAMPAQVCLTDDGDDVPGLMIDAAPLLEQALRRQAREWCRSVADGEGAVLEQLLAMARHHRLDLIVTHDAAGGCEAGWWSDDAPKEAVASAKAPGLTSAIRAATCELLGIDPAAELRMVCETCQHWKRDAAPAVTDGCSRPCVLAAAAGAPDMRHPGASCPDRWEPLDQADTDPAPGSDEFETTLAWARSIVDEPTTPKTLRRQARKWLAQHAPGVGVTAGDNLIRSEGDGS